MTIDLPVVYLFCAAEVTYGAGQTDYRMMAIADDGDVLAEHICSDPSFGPYDLHKRESRHATYAAKFGEWGDGVRYTVVEIPYRQPGPPGFDAAVKALLAAEADAEAQ
jgi:hypothetical protein